MSEKLEIARRALLETALADKRDLNAPLSGRRQPEPSKHPDMRMRLTLEDMKQCMKTQSS